MATVLISEFFIVLHQWDNSWYTKVQLFYERAKGRCIFHHCRVIFEFGQSSICDIMSFPIPSFAPFLCSSAKVVHQPLKVERSGGKPFRAESSSYESIQPENLSPFNVCTQKCRRLRKWTTDENVEKDKLTAYKRVLTLITHLYAVLVSIHRGTIILHHRYIGQAVNITPSKNIERFIRCY